MHIQFTEQFLWQLYEIMQTIGRVHALVAPHSLYDVLSPEFRDLRRSYKEKKRSQSFSHFISYLKKQGYIKIPSGYGIEYTQFTAKGVNKAFEGSIKSKHWERRPDGKMIMVMYDIPENKKAFRSIFREFLVAMEYNLLQKSVWISVKDVLRETERVIYEYELESYVKVFVLERIDIVKRKNMGKVLK